MRKNQRGRKPKYSKLAVQILRDKENMSYSEIAKQLGMKSAQLARYYYREAKGSAIDKKI